MPDSCPLGSEGTPCTALNTVGHIPNRFAHQHTSKYCAAMRTNEPHLKARHIHERTGRSAANPTTALHVNLPISGISADVVSVETFCITLLPLKNCCKHGAPGICNTRDCLHQTSRIDRKQGTSYLAAEDMGTLDTKGFCCIPVIAGHTESWAAIRTGCIHAPEHSVHLQQRSNGGRL